MTTGEEVLRETVLHEGSGMRRQLPRAHADLGRGGADDKSESLAAQLASATAEIETLRRRLLEDSSPSALAAQLANAKAESDALRQQLFELSSYRVAYERLLGEQSRPPADNS